MKRRILLLMMLFALLTAGMLSLIAMGKAKAAPENGYDFLKKNQSADEEFRAVWIPYLSLEASRGKEAFTAKAEEIVSAATELGVNTLIFQVRPFGDSLYPSALFPWSHILTGAQGVNPEFDPLQIMLDCAHHAGLALHAWINPLRIRSNGVPSQFSEDNPYILWQKDDDPSNDGWTVAWENGIYYDPSVPQVRKLIIDGVRELVANYAVDGVHIDDYFYPTQSPDFDSAAYAEYCRQAQKQGQALSLAQWRKQNINLLVSGIYSAVKEGNPSLVFGISPQGNTENCEKSYADIQSWAQTEGYADYICPQMYYGFDNKSCPFDQVALQWRQMTVLPSVKLYGGIGLYKAETEWQNDRETIAKQVAFLQSQGYDGFALYSYDYLASAKQVLGNLQSKPH